MKSKGHLLTTKPGRGFTIVELLIVVVIIGILATIVIVTFNGIQARAQNAKTLVAVDAYKKALAMYVAEHGSPPDYSFLPSGGACLGTGYPDVNHDGLGDCIVGSDGTTIIMSALAAGTDPLETYLGKQIELGGPLARRSFEAAPNDQNFVLSQVRINPGYGGTLDGKPVLWWIVYIMQGKGQDCRSPIVRAAGDTTSNTFFSAAHSDDTSFPWRECYEVFI